MNKVLGMRLLLQDFQRGGQILEFNPELTKSWEDSLKSNDYDYELIYVDKGIDGYNLGCNKIFKFLEVLKEYRGSLNKVILSDTLDVVFLKPGVFEFMEDNTLYVGDEPTNLGIEWIYENSLPIIQKDLQFKDWFNKNKNRILLNTGLIGGKVDIVINVLERIYKLLYSYCKNTDIGADMGALNYVVYNMYDSKEIKLITGKPFNTVFKTYDYNNINCFLAHK